MYHSPSLLASFLICIPFLQVGQTNGSMSNEVNIEPASQKKCLSSTAKGLSEDEDFTGSKKERKASNATRFTIYKVNKASRKKREKSSAKKERKATKTLAIVLGKTFSFFRYIISTNSSRKGENWELLRNFFNPETKLYIIPKKTNSWCKKHFQWTWIMMEKHFSQIIDVSILNIFCQAHIPSSPPPPIKTFTFKNILNDDK